MSNIIIILCLIAWTGESWGPMTRNEINDRATQMIYTNWSPNENCRGWNTSVSPAYFYPNNTYQGVLYSQNNPQENWTEFSYGITHLPYDYYGYWSGNRWYNYYGNDCSGFVSICWKLPARWTTWNFYSDANGSQNYCYKIGSTGSAATAPLEKGDALNKYNSHIILFNYRSGSNAIISMEQTPNKARIKTWYYSNLSYYQPIRRKNLTSPSPFVKITNYPPTSVNAGATFSVRYYFYIPAEKAPADLIFEIKDKNTGQVIHQQKAQNIGTGYWYKTFYTSLPDKGYNYYVYSLAYLTPKGGNWNNRYCYIATSNNPTKVKTVGSPAGIEVVRKSGNLSAGATYTFSVNLSGRHTVVMCGNNNADFDLYAKWNSAPTTSSYDYRGYTGSSLEWFTVDGSGNLYIMVRSYSGNGNWRCNAITSHPANYYKNSGYLSGTGNYQWWYVYGSGGSDKGWAYLSGPDNTDFDLYVKWNSIATPSNYSACGYSGWSQEICSYPGSGDYYMTANSYRGSGYYNILGLIFTGNKGLAFINMNDQDPKDEKLERKIPVSYQLCQNLSNPFKNSTSIKYAIPKRSHVTIRIYNQTGQSVRTLIDKVQGAGYYTTIWDGKNTKGKALPSGIYFYTLKTANFFESKRMILMK